LAQQFGPLSGAGIEVLVALPVSEYPLLAQTAKAAKSVSADQEFEVGSGSS